MKLALVIWSMYIGYQVRKTGFDVKAGHAVREAYDALQRRNAVLFFEEYEKREAAISEG